MKKGDKFKVINKAAGFDVGTIVTFTRYDEDDYTMAWFTGTTKLNDVDEWPVTLTKVVPYVEGRTILVSSKETTPTTKALYGEEEEEVDKYATCKERGWKEGDLFTYISDDETRFPERDIIELVFNDETDCVRFRSVETGEEHWAYTYEVEPYVAPVEDEDMVNSPSHYTSGDIECIDAIEAALTPEEFVGYLKGNQLKYIWRMGKKGDAAQDLDKSMWYGRKLMETINEI